MRPAPGTQVAAFPYAAILSLALFAAPDALAAQTGIRLLPQVGFYTPLTDLGAARDNDQTLISAGRRSATLAVGLGLETGAGRAGTGVRVLVGYGTRAPIPVAGTECPACSARGTVLTATVAAVHRPLPRVVLVQPHFLLGAGVKRYDFDVRGAATDGDGWRDVFRNQTRPTLQAGIGAEAGILGLRTQLELNALTSRFDTGDRSDAETSTPRLQTEIFLTLAVPIGG